MFIADVFVALVIGLIIVWIVSTVFRTRGPWDSFLLFFLVVALFAWAGGVWIVPFGPLWGGIGWLPIILMGFFAALLLTAASPRTPRKRTEAQEKELVASERTAVVDAIFWALIICLVLFGLGHYYVW